MSLRTRALSSLAAVAVTGAITLVAAPAAHASTLTVAYDATGSSLVAKTNSTVNLGPATLTAAINGDGSFTASLPLPSTSTSFKVLGLLPATATVTFVPAAPLSGVITPSPVTISSTAKYNIKLSNVKVAGVPAFVGSKCQTAAPVSIPVSGPFNVINGGTLSGTYTIGNFANCGLTTTLINLLIPGGGNTVQFTLSNGRLAS